MTFLSRDARQARGLGDARNENHWRQAGAQVEAAVESVLEFGAIALGVLGELECVVGVGQTCLDISEHPVDRPELRQLGAKHSLV
ncbi:MAG: hypothetical protein IPH51_22665 [Rubrivivax sp.]|nr:hypothetical protein [Rubrivivax sp.]